MSVVDVFVRASCYVGRIRFGQLRSPGAGLGFAGDEGTARLECRGVGL
jgi:hypothetical protein